MKRRLYFLFPDEVHARHAIDNLMDGAGVEAPHIHAVARDEAQLKRLPRTTRLQRMDAAGRLEDVLWNSNLGLFGLGLGGLVYSAFKRLGPGMIISLLVMAATFVAGLLFTKRVPAVHVRNLRSALSRGEILVMVDVPRAQVVAVEDYMHHRYPEAVAAGAGWSGEALGM